MIRTLRGAWSRRGTLLPLLLLTVVVVAGAVAVLGFADAAGTSQLLAAPLLLLAMVAVPATGRELAIARRPEIALARLRGLDGGPLYAVLALEPLLVLLLGGLLGVLGGTALAAVTAEAWVGDAGTPFSSAAVLATFAIVLVGLGAVLIGMVGAVREPLVDQLRLAARPRRTSTGEAFGQVLIVVAALVAAYRSDVGSDADPDALVLVGPALIGLAAGQVGVWLLRGAARLAVRRTAYAAVPAFLASRRLARVADAATALRVLVAAAVVAGLAVTGATQVDDWTSDTARLRAGAPLRYDLDTDATGALALVQRLDPEGRWLMAAVLVPGEGSVPARRAFLDLSRYDAVLGDFYTATPAAGLSSTVALLGSGTPAYAAGGRLSVTVAGVSRRLKGELHPTVDVTYRLPDGTVSSVGLQAELPLSGEPVTTVLPFDVCPQGCEVVGLTLRRAPGDIRLPWVLTGLEVGGLDVLDLDLRPSPLAPTRVATGLLVGTRRAPAQASVGPAPGAVPVLATDTASWRDGDPILDSPGGEDLPARVVARLPALPLVEGDGLLADLPSAATGAPPTVPIAEVMVLARADTPDDLRDALADVALAPRTLDEVEQEVSDASGAAQALVYALMALFCLVAALLVLAAAVARERGAWIRDVAALRVVGLGRERIRAASVVEVGGLLVVAVAASLGGSAAAIALLLGNLPLVDVPVHAVPLSTAVALAPLLALAGIVAALVAIVVGRGRRFGADGSRPAILREQAQR